MFEFLFGKSRDIKESAKLLIENGYRVTKDDRMIYKSGNVYVVLDIVRIQGMVYYNPENFNEKIFIDSDEATCEFLRGCL